MRKTLSALTFIAACFTVSTASARTAPLQECESSAECPESYTCVLQSVEACPDCAEGESCPPCVVETYGYCEPPPPEQCASDADCEGNDVCVSYTYGSCSGSSGGAPDPICVDGEPCERPMEEEVCEESTEAYCVPPYYAPCQVDADCGGGFTCEDLEVCSSSSDTTEIDCAPTGDKYCQLIPVTCEDNGDCAGGFECLNNGGSTEPAPPGDTEGEPDGGGSILPFPDDSPFCAPVGYSGGPSIGGVNSPVGEADGAERLSWGEDSGSGDSGSKGDSGCTTAEGNASLGIFGLFALIALRLRR